MSETAARPGIIRNSQTSDLICGMADLSGRTSTRDQSLSKQRAFVHHRHHRRDTENGWKIWLQLKQNHSFRTYRMQ